MSGFSSSRLGRSVGVPLVGAQLTESLASGFFLKAVKEAEVVLVENFQMTEAALGKAGIVPKSSYIVLEHGGPLQSLARHWGKNPRDFKLDNVLGMTSKPSILVAGANSEIRFSASMSEASTARGGPCLHSIFGDLAEGRKLRLYRLVRDATTMKRTAYGHNPKLGKAVAVTFKNLEPGRLRILQKLLTPTWIGGGIVLGGVLGALAAVGISYFLGENQKVFSKRAIAGAISGGVGSAFCAMSGGLILLGAMAMSYMIDERINEALA